MKIIKSVVQKMTIMDVKNLDPVAVIVEDHGPGAGKITITCFDDCWTNYWGCMGEQHTLASFFTKCDEHYLAGKLKSGIRNEIDDDDEEVLTKTLRAEIIRSRRDGDFEKEQARDFWDSSDTPLDYNGYIDSELFGAVFGDDWWHSRPKKPNPDYEYLCRIIKVVQEAMRLDAVKAPDEASVACENQS